jgi:hypothetical protein
MGGISSFTYPLSILACDVVMVRDYSQMQGFAWSVQGLCGQVWGLFVKCRALYGLVRGFVFIMF